MDAKVKPTELCSSSLFLDPFLFFGSFDFLDIELDVVFLNGSPPPPELLPYLLEDIMVKAPGLSRFCTV